MGSWKYPGSSPCSFKYLAALRGPTAVLLSASISNTPHCLESFQNLCISLRCTTKEIMS